MRNGDPTLCNEPRCKNLRRKDRKRCYTHDTRRRREANPMRAAWRCLKDHAAARGIPFALKLWQFRKFAIKTDYLNRTGSNGHCLTVDRINNLLGYVLDALNVLEKDNVIIHCGETEPSLVIEEGDFKTIIQGLVQK